MKQDLHETITTKELVTNFDLIIDKVHIEEKSFLIKRGSQTIAMLTPPSMSGYPVEKLAILLKSLPSLGDDAKLFEQDLKKLNSHAKLKDNLLE